MKRLIPIMILLWFFNLNLKAQGHIQRLKVANKYTCDVYIPLSYDQKKEYPVVYMNDGDNFFSPLGWDGKALLDLLIKQNKIEPIIYVAIHAGPDRVSRYLPYLDSFITSQVGHYIPQAKAYSKDLISEVFIQIEEKYSINPKKRALIGVSFSGLFSTWFATKHNSVSFVASLSPSYWVNNFEIFKELDALSQLTHWFDIGTAEWNYYLPIANKLKDSKKVSSYYLEVPNGAHNISSWRARLEYPLKIFAGDVGKAKHLEIVEECIPSKRNKSKIYYRINPIITTTTGIRYSIPFEINYTFNQEAIDLKQTGQYRLLKKNTKVEGSFNDLKAHLNLTYCKNN